jgi:PAS domain S-box-containing protein
MSRPAARLAPEGRRGRALLAWAGALLLVVVLGAIGAAAWRDRTLKLSEAAERNALLARLFADSVTRNIESAALANATLAELLQRGVAPAGPEMRTALQQTLVSLPFLRGLGIVDERGNIVGSTDPGELNHRIALAALGVSPGAATSAGPPDRLGRYAPVRRLPELAAGRAGTPTPAGVGFLPLLRRVTLPGGGGLWLVAMINAEAFANFQQSTLDDKASAAALLSYDGHLIAATAGVAHKVGATLAALPPYTDFLPRLEHGGWTGIGLRPGTQIAAFRVSATRPLVVIVERGEQDVFDDWFDSAKPLCAAALGAAGVIAAMTLLAVRSQRAREVARRERDEAQRAVARRERELSVTLKSLQELVFRTDAEGAIVFVNEPWVDLTGSVPAAADGRLLSELVRVEDRRAVRHLFTPRPDAALRRAEARVADHGGGERCLEIAVMPLHGPGGELLGFAGSAVDVTARTVAQDRLQTQLAFTEQLMDVSPLPKSVMTIDGHYVLVNKAWEEFTGQHRAEVVGTRVGRHLPRSEQLLHEAHDRQLVASAQPVRYETMATHRDGSPRDIIVNKLLLPSEEGKPPRILSVLVDVTEFRNAERATREARDIAEEASRAKSEFIANISHELRTPLQSIIGFSELGQHHGREQARLAAMFGDIHSAGVRMLHLVNDLLDVAKIESTVGTIHLERTDLRGLVREVLREIDPLLSQRQLRVDLRLPQTAMRAKVDPPRFQQVMRNVLANAIKFSPRQGRIELVGEHTAEGELHLRVSDQGPGVPPAEVETIFEAFVQSSQTKDGSGGTGLGLAICRKIIEAHGGRIGAANRAGGGSVFHIHLPARGAGETLPMPL